MFWGLKINNDKSYSRALDKSIHVTCAVLDPVYTMMSNGVIQLHVTVNECDYIIALFDQNNGVMQLPLNIELSHGEEITFHLEPSDTKARVHLSGYYRHDNTSSLPQQPLGSDGVIDQKKSKKRKRVSFDGTTINQNDIPSDCTNTNNTTTSAIAAIEETIQDLKYGHGKIAKNGRTVYVRYIGRDADSKRVIQRIGKGERSLQFALGKGEVMKALDKGIKGMRVGGTRKIIISPTGRKSSQIGIDIPCDRTIELEVDLVNVD